MKNQSRRVIRIRISKSAKRAQSRTPMTKKEWTKVLGKNSALADGCNLRRGFEFVSLRPLT